MPVSGIRGKSITISIPLAEYEYIESLIKKTADSTKTVPGYIKRLIRYYVWTLRTEEEIKRSEKNLRRMREGQESDK